MYGSDIFCGIAKGTFEVPHKISHPYIERCGFYSQVNFQELLDLRAHKCFWNAPRYTWFLSCVGSNERKAGCRQILIYSMKITQTICFDLANINSPTTNPFVWVGLQSFSKVVVTFNHVGGSFNLFKYHYWRCLVRVIRCMLSAFHVSSRVVANISDHGSSLLLPQLVK